jgi:hypothetical protein
MKTHLLQFLPEEKTTFKRCDLPFVTLSKGVDR